MGYTDDLARMKQYRAAESRNEIIRELSEYQQSHLEAEERAAEAVARGYTDMAESYLDEADTQKRYAEDAARRLAEVQRELPPPNALSEHKQRWIAQRADLAAHPDAAQAAQWTHWHLTQNMGVKEDSDSYFELMAMALEPQGYEPQITPDEVCARLGLDADEYNEQVMKLYKAKASGQYNERG